MKDTDKVRSLIAKVVPNMGQLDQIKQKNGEFHIPGRSFVEARFPTENGLAKFNPSPIPKLDETTLPLSLISLRSEGQFNTVVYEDEDFYRGQERRDVILLNPEMMEALKLEKDDLVTVSSKIGQMKNILVRPFDVQKDAAIMYYPESNVLISREVDKASLTPAYKNTPIKITKQNMVGNPENITSANPQKTSAAAMHGFKKAMRPKLKQC